jgi:Asp-tRNA(Asn)/Glu-tRNA(Gln) amidotransferase A subunit family amidase
VYEWDRREGWRLGQKVDATLVTRLLDAGGIIKGKAACENNCFGAVRFVVTAITNVHAKP